MIKKCSCKSAYQDKKHGEGKRVANPQKKDASGKQRYKCTVCGKIIEHTDQLN